MRHTLTALLFLASASHAQDGLSAQEFDELLTGQTVTYLYSDGVSVGIEAYHPNQRVTWLVGDGVCQKGRWYAQDGQICFHYEGDDLPQCTWFSHNNGTFVSDHGTGSGVWTSTSVTTAPINCTMDFVGS